MIVPPHTVDQYPQPIVQDPTQTSARVHMFVPKDDADCGTLHTLNSRQAIAFGLGLPRSFKKLGIKI